MTMTDHTRATSKIVVHPPVYEMPGTRLIVSATAATVPRYLSKVCISQYYHRLLWHAKHGSQKSKQSPVDQKSFSSISSSAFSSSSSSSLSSSRTSSMASSDIP